MGEPLLGADGRDRLRLRIELDVVALAVPGRDRLAQAGDALGGRIAVVARVARRFHQLVDDVLGRGLVGVAHPEVDDVFTIGPGFRLQVIDDGEDVRREPLDPIEVVHGAFSIFEG
jgi:hypothetical protein